MNILLVIGIIILLGAIAGRVFYKFNLPQVTGYIMIGLFLGQSFSGFLNAQMMESFRPILSLALGVIGFLIGAELRSDRFKKYSRSIYTILFVETFLTFLFVGSAVFLMTKKVYLGLIMGALASATAPAATYAVLGECKARGPVTMTTLSIVALDDALALLIYGFVSVFARALFVHGEVSFMSTIAVPVLEIAGSVLIGAVSGYVLHHVCSKSGDKERILPFTLGTIILVVGLAIFFKVDPILASMVLGAVVSNLQPPENREMFDIMKRLSSPIFILFFVLVGARLDARIVMKGGVLLIGVVYILSRSAGKIAGAYIGGKMSNAKDTVTKYLGFCLFDQAGVAVGLAIAAFQAFSALGPAAHREGLFIINVITTTTFIFQIIAPPMIRYGARKADEMNRNVTEDDIIDRYKVRDIMEEDFFVIKENYNLHQMIDIMKESDAYDFSVVGMDGKFMGIISLGELRETFNEVQMDQLVLASDIVQAVGTVAYADQDLRDVMKIFKAKNIDYLPVMEKKGSGRLVGQLKYRKITERIEKEVMLRQQELEL
ncbi:MAG: cation:proton antiporter [Candidatus Omnitrophota bacterium]